MAENFTVPHPSPAYGPPPYYMREAEIILVDVEVEPQAAAEAIPPPLQLAENSRAQFFVGDMLQIPHIGKFHEGGILLQAVHGHTQAAVTPYLWTSSDESMLVGREVYGMPKMMCDDTPLVWNGNEIQGCVRRRGVDLMCINFRFERHLDPSDLHPNTDRLSVRHFQDPVDPDSRDRETLYIPLTDYSLKEAWSGSAVVTMEPSVSSKAHMLVPLRVLGAYYFRGSWTLDRAQRLD